MVLGAVHAVSVAGCLQAQEDLIEAKVLTQALEAALDTHTTLSHETHGSQGVAALTDHLATANLAGRTSACSLAQVRWKDQGSPTAKDVTHTGLAVEGMRLVEGGVAFSAPSPSGQVALHPTAAQQRRSRPGSSGNAGNATAVEECYVIDEQARVLKRMYLRDAAARRAARAGRAAQESGAVPCMPVAPRMGLCEGVGGGPRAGVLMSWSSARVFHSCRDRGMSSRLQSEGATPRAVMWPSGIAQAAHCRPRRQVQRQASLGANLRCMKMARRVAVR